MSVQQLNSICSGKRLEANYQENFTTDLQVPWNRTYAVNPACNGTYTINAACNRTYALDSNREETYLKAITHSIYDNDEKDKNSEEESSEENSATPDFATPNENSLSYETEAETSTSVDESNSTEHNYEEYSYNDIISSKTSRQEKSPVLLESHEDPDCTLSLDSLSVESCQTSDSAESAIHENSSSSTGNSFPHNIYIFLCLKSQIIKKSYNMRLNFNMLRTIQQSVKCVCCTWFNY